MSHMSIAGEQEETISIHSELDVSFFYKEPLYKESTCRMPKYLKKTYITRGKFPRKLFNLTIIVTANNQELGSCFHSFAAETLIDCLLCLF